MPQKFGNDEYSIHKTLLNKTLINSYIVGFIEEILREKGYLVGKYLTNHQTSPNISLFRTILMDNKLIF